MEHTIHIKLQVHCTEGEVEFVRQAALDAASAKAHEYKGGISAESAVESGPATKELTCVVQGVEFWKGIR